MAEAGRYPVREVELQGLRLGHLINVRGESFSLSNIFSDEASILGADKFVEVYFSTGSGNVYRLDQSGLLINRDQSIQLASFHSVRLRPEDLTSQILTVGERFDYGIGNTTPLREIVPATGRVYAREYLERITKGRKSTIIEDFLQGLPRMPRRRI